jgi:DNA-binding SARP family transcriptional activator
VLPANEALYRLRMRVEHRANGTSGVQRAYNELSNILQTDDCTPSKLTHDLYQQLVNRADERNN